MHGWGVRSKLVAHHELNEISPHAASIRIVCCDCRITVVIGVGLFSMLKYQQHLAKKGSVRAARAVLLPIYEPLVVMLVASLLAEYFFLYLQHTAQETVLITVFAQWSLEQFVQTGLVLFFCSHSLSQASMGRSLFYAIGCGVVGFATAAIHRT
jgi:hypothetical protein